MSLQKGEIAHLIKECKKERKSIDVLIKENAVKDTVEYRIGGDAMPLYRKHIETKILIKKDIAKNVKKLGHIVNLLKEYDDEFNHHVIQYHNEGKLSLLIEKLNKGIDLYKKFIIELRRLKSSRRIWVDREGTMRTEVL